MLDLIDPHVSQNCQRYARVGKKVFDLENRNDFPFRATVDKVDNADCFAREMESFQLLKIQFWAEAQLEISRRLRLMRARTKSLEAKNPTLNCSLLSKPEKDEFESERAGKIRFL